MMVRKEFFPFLPPSEMKIITNWEAQLKRGLHGTDRPPIESMMLLDLIVAEGHERGMELTKELVRKDRKWGPVISRGMVSLSRALELETSLMKARFALACARRVTSWR